MLATPSNLAWTNRLDWMTSSMMHLLRTSWPSMLSLNLFKTKENRLLHLRNICELFWMQRINPRFICFKRFLVRILEEQDFRKQNPRCPLLVSSIVLWKVCLFCRPLGITIFWTNRCSRRNLPIDYLNFDWKDWLTTEKLYNVKTEELSVIIIFVYRIHCNRSTSRR